MSVTRPTRSTPHRPGDWGPTRMSPWRPDGVLVGKTVRVELDVQAVALPRPREPGRDPRLQERGQVSMTSAEIRSLVSTNW